jgi:hypothetical protein
LTKSAVLEIGIRRGNYAANTDLAEHTHVISRINIVRSGKLIESVGTREA